MHSIKKLSGNDLFIELRQKNVNYRVAAATVPLLPHRTLVVDGIFIPPVQTFWHIASVLNTSFHFLLLQFDMSLRILTKLLASFQHSLAAASIVYS